MIQAKPSQAMSAIAAATLPPAPFLLSDDVAQFVGTVRIREPHHLRAAAFAPPVRHDRAGIRSIEFGEARKFASALLARLGAPEPVVAEGSGIPQWPRGFVGSIAVNGMRVAVAVALQRPVVGIGIDIDTIADASSTGETGSRCLSAAERDLMAALDLDEATFAAVCTSTKESLYKCLRPIVAFDFEREEARITSIEVASGTTRIALLRDLSPQFRAGSALVGRFRHDESHVYTSIELRR